jgi:hypothetical protein
VLGLVPAAAAAQETTEPAPPQARAFLSGGVRLTEIRGNTVSMIGAEGVLGIAGEWSVGGGAWILSQPSDIEGSTPGSDLRLRIAYGGLLVERRLGHTGSVSWAARALLGAGNAKLSLPAVETEIGADNFGVVEPELRASIPLVGWLRFDLRVGYRSVFGVEDLAQVTSAQIRGITAGVAFTLGPF